MKTYRGYWLVPLALSAAVLLAGSTVWGQLPSPQELKQQFQETDRNGDGKVDREEFHRRSVELFYFFDKDRKGYLVLVDIRNLTPEHFKAADRNGDGKLTLDEFLNARFRQFDLADSNGDGVVTIEEVEVYVNRLR
jgi:Ca2+-binding EF-hand superfamily protein